MLSENVFWRRAAWLGVKAPKGAVLLDAPVDLAHTATQTFGVSKRTDLSALTPSAVQQDFVRAAITYGQATNDARAGQLRIAVISGLVVDAIVGLASALFALKSEMNTLTVIVAGSLAAQFILATFGYVGFTNGMNGEQKGRFLRFLIGASFVRVFEFMFAAFAFVFILSGAFGDAGGAVVAFVDNWTTSVADFFYDMEGRSNRELLVVDVTKGLLAFLPTVILAMTGGLAFGRPRPADS